MIQYFRERKYSEKQAALLNYLLKRLGFEDNPGTMQYIEKLEMVAHIFRNNRAIYDPNQEISSQDIPKYYYFDGDKYIPERYNIIDFLIDEYSLKKKQEYEIINTLSDYISATDLANYTFCPVGFSINSSFNIKSNKLAEVGERLHESARLINKFDFQIQKSIEDKEGSMYNVEKYINETNKTFFNLLIDSKLVFSGHKQDVNQKGKKYFTNESLKFIGQPDYVFIDKYGKNFIVEEKFKRDTGKASAFYNNHKVQLASYIYYLNSLNAQYGYLVYWYYEYHDYQFNYLKCEVYRIDKTVNGEIFLSQVYNGVKEFRRKKTYKVESQILNGIKCASCVYCMYCGHKTGKIEEVTLPYSRKYHVLHKEPYPEILKKEPIDTDQLAPQIDSISMRNQTYYEAPTNDSVPMKTKKSYFVDNTPTELDHL